MSSYCSFLVFRKDEFELVRSISVEAGWPVYGIIDPSMRYRFSATGMTEVTKASALPTFGPLHKDEDFGQVLVLKTEQDEANNIIQLILAANLILEGVPNRLSLDGHGYEIHDDPTERAEITENIFRKNGYFEQFTYRETLPVAVAVAAKAWSDHRLIYAVHKLAESKMTVSVSPHSMHPRYGQVFQKHSFNFSSHVGTSIAMNLAFSAIEELGLIVRSSARNPRWLDNKKFIWNPVVLEELNSRLVDAGVDTKKTFDWVIRGEDSEVDVHPIRDTLANYSDGLDVRDKELSLPDAINECEYMRSYMTAHAFSSSTHLIGPYEVFNAQQVARFLILSKCGLWNVWTSELLTRHMTLQP